MAWGVWAAAPPRPCPERARILYVRVDSLAPFPPDFADTLARRMAPEAAGLGYCPRPWPKAGGVVAAVADSAANPWLLHLTYNPNAHLLSAGLLRLNAWSPVALARAMAHPLLELPHAPAEGEALFPILSQKIAENLRQQYVAEVTVESDPPGAWAASDGGLGGPTPVEWIVPVGTLELSLTKAGYLPRRERLDLRRPGLHAYRVELSRRRFYHSACMYPAGAAALAGLACRVLEDRYYARYQALGQADLDTRPEVFGQTFRRARLYERLGAGFWAAGALCLGLSFKF